MTNWKPIFLFFFWNKISSSKINIREQWDRQQTETRSKVSGGKSNPPPFLLPPPLSCPFVHIRLVPRLVISLPVPKFCEGNFHLSSCTFLPFTGLSPSAGGHPSILLFFPLNSSDTWPFSLSSSRLFPVLECSPPRVHSVEAKKRNERINFAVLKKN